jgi:DNA-binding MarR family transcriptional regulator
LDAYSRPFIPDPQGDSVFALDDQISLLLKRAHQRASAIFQDRLGGYQLTPTQFFALARLHEMGQLSQNRLGRLSAMDPATIQGVIHRLVDRKLIQRMPDPTDRRRMVLRLTNEGQELVGSLLSDAAAIDEMALERLSPEERKTLTTLLRKMI